MREREGHITFIITCTWFVPNNHFSVMILIKDKGYDKLHIDPTIEKSALTR